MAWELRRRFGQPIAPAAAGENWEVYALRAESMTTVVTSRLRILLPTHAVADVLRHNFDALECRRCKKRHSQALPCHPHNVSIVCKTSATSAACS
jgi:hypothetical protein